MKFIVLLLSLALSFYTFTSEITLTSNYPEDCESWGYVEGHSFQGIKEAMQDLTKKAVEAGADTMYLDRVDVTDITTHDIEEPVGFSYSLWANTYVCKNKP
jgi:hypothetical protein